METPSFNMAVDTSIEVSNGTVGQQICTQDQDVKVLEHSDDDYVTKDVHEGEKLAKICNTKDIMEKDKLLEDKLVDGLDDLGITDTNTEDTSCVHISSNDGLPIDRGWAWVVLAASFFYMVLFGGIKRTFGIFFVAFQTKFDSTASQTAFLTTLQCLLVSCSSLLVMTVASMFMSNRMLIIIGSLCLTSANIITAFATNIQHLFISVGILEGIGTALVHPAITATVGEYFHQWRGLANGLALSGGNFGGLIFSPVMSALFVYYGYTGTLLISAGITFNIMITGVLLRPLSSFEKARMCSVSEQKKSTELLQKKTLMMNEKLIYSGNESNMVAHDNLNENVKEHFGSGKEIYNRNIKIVGKLLYSSDTTLNCSGINRKNDKKLPTNPLFLSVLTKYNINETAKDTNLETVFPLIPRSRACSDVIHCEQTLSKMPQKLLPPLDNFLESLSCSKMALYGSTDVAGTSLCASLIGMSDILNEKGDTKLREADESNVETCCHKLGTIFDVNLFTNLVFPTFLGMAFIFAPVCGLTPIFIIPLAKDIGLTADERAILLSVFGGVGLASRIVLALLVDKKYIRLTTLLAVAAIVLGIFLECVRFLRSFESFIILAVVMGLCCEIYQAMYPVILVEYLTLSKLKNCLGFTLLCHGIANAATNTAMGSLRDATGTYVASYHLIGTMSLAGAGIALLLPYVHRRHELRTKSQGYVTQIEIVK